MKEVQRWECRVATNANGRPYVDDIEFAAGRYVLYSDHEAEIARLRAEVEGLRDVLAPFAEYERVRSKMGGTSPKSGQLFGVHSSAGSAELSVEDFKAAITAMGASA